MKTAVCHYSFHRLWKSENWDAERLAALTHRSGLPIYGGGGAAADGPAGALGGLDGRGCRFP